MRPPACLSYGLLSVFLFQGHLQTSGALAQPLLGERKWNEQEVGGERICHAEVLPPFFLCVFYPVIKI
jgi:hypothetical protein